jgi:prevent-host-death family protein
MAIVYVYGHYVMTMSMILLVCAFGRWVVRQMAAGEFKAQCLAVMDEVAATREPVVITKRGEPVAKLVPVEKTSRKKLMGRLVGVLPPSKDDLTQPTVPLKHWESLK